MWAGDSRLYRFRRGELKRISRDHSQVEEMLARGLISAEEAESHPSSNVITRAVGAGRDLFVDITAFDIEADDTFMLCSDGLYNEVAEEDIVTCLNMKHVEQSTTTLLNYALSSGARDNVSVVVSRAYLA
jgi:serine/threonine protein phosphatase PrpC